MLCVRLVHSFICDYFSHSRPPCMLDVYLCLCSEKFVKYLVELEEQIETICTGKTTLNFLNTFYCLRLYCNERCDSESLLNTYMNMFLKVWKMRYVCFSVFVFVLFVFNFFQKYFGLSLEYFLFVLKTTSFDMKSWRICEQNDLYIV